MEACCLMKLRTNPAAFILIIHILTRPTSHSQTTCNSSHSTELSTPRFSAVALFSIFLGISFQLYSPSGPNARLSSRAIGVALFPLMAPDFVSVTFCVPHKQDDRCQHWLPPTGHSYLLILTMLSSPLDGSPDRRTEVPTHTREK